MEKKEQLYEGKAKKVFATGDPNLVVVSYKDDATAFDGAKKGTIRGKGVVFVGELKGRRIEDDAFLHAVALGKAPGGDVAAASGTPGPAKSWTRTASAGTWATWRRPTRR